MQSPTFTWYPLVPLTAHFAPFADRIACRRRLRTVETSYGSGQVKEITYPGGNRITAEYESAKALAAHFAPFADRIACRCQPRTALKALEAADRIPFCPPHITESGHYATTASPTTRQIYFLSSLPAKPSQLSALPRRSDSILQRFPRKRYPIFSLQLRFLTVLLLPDPAPPFQSWFSHSFPSASANMYLWSCYDADQIMEPLSGNSPSAPPEGPRSRRPHPFLSAPHHRKRSLCHDCFANSKTDLLPFIAPRQALTAVRSSPAFRFDSPPFKRFPRKRYPIFSLQLRFLTVLLLPDPAPPFQSWFSHSFPSASADMYLWSCYDADQIMEPLSGNSPSAPP